MTSSAIIRSLRRVNSSAWSSRPQVSRDPTRAPGGPEPGLGCLADSPHTQFASPVAPPSRACTMPPPASSTDQSSPERCCWCLLSRKDAGISSHLHKFPIYCILFGHPKQPPRSLPRGEGLRVFERDTWKPSTPPGTALHARSPGEPNSRAGAGSACPLNDASHACHHPLVCSSILMRLRPRPVQGRRVLRLFGRIPVWNLEVMRRPLPRSMRAPGDAWRRGDGRRRDRYSPPRSLRADFGPAASHRAGH